MHLHKIKFKFHSPKATATLPSGKSQISNLYILLEAAILTFEAVSSTPY